MKRKTFYFVTNCVNSGDGQAIQDMVVAAKQITRQTFLGYVDRHDLRQQELELSYQLHPRSGLTMAGDWHVSYYRSEYKGRPCVYFRHSAIEYIFQPIETAWECLPPARRSAHEGWSATGEFFCPRCPTTIGKNLKGERPFLLAQQHLSTCNGMA